VERDGAATEAKAGTPESNDPGPMKASKSEARIINEAAVTQDIAGTRLGFH